MVPPFRKTTETPQLQYVFWWSMPLLCRSCLRCPLLLRQARMVQTLRKFVEVLQLQFLPGCGRRCVYAATSCLATVKMPQIQFNAGVRGHSSRHRDRYAQLQLCMVGTVAAMRGSLLQFCNIFRIDRDMRQVSRLHHHHHQTFPLKSMELAAALNHSRDGGRATNYGLRAP